MQPIKAKAYFLLSRRAYFTKQLSRKLLEKGYPEAEIESLIKELSHKGYLNDRELADRYIESQKRKGYGPRVIAQKLREKAGELDLSHRDIDEADDEETLRSFIIKRHLKYLPEKRDKVIQSLMRRGYSYGLINKILGSIRGDNE